MTKISEFKSQGDSISLAQIGDKPFTIVAVVDSVYEKGTGDNKKSTPGKKITCQETFTDKNGKSSNKLHTTRVAIVNKLSNPQLLESLKNGPIGPVKCVEVQGKNGGNPYWDLVDATA